MNKLDLNEFSIEYFQNALQLKQSGSEVERIGNTLFNSKIKLTPHQIQAALFAFRSPLRKGVILADEVGLGKTIEAGIVIAQKWLEKKGKILIIAPASLIRQWQNELEDKFNLKSIILDRKLYNLNVKKGYSNPIKAIKEDIIICSYQICSSLKEDIRMANFELVIIDEAHKLRNVHNEKSITANNIKYSIQYSQKVLLTATPIQNSLMDLYGLCSIIDEDIFGDKEIFRYNYIKNYLDNEDELESRLKMVMHRTLRSQVREYIQFTNRIPKTFSFKLTETELVVYQKIRDILNNSETESYLIPNSQRHLLVLILCKLMGSSMRAIVETMTKMRDRLIALKEGNEEQVDYYDFEEILDEELEDIEEIDCDENTDENVIDIDKLNNEINNLEEIINLANSVKDESKFFALKDALEYSFSHLKKLGAEEKVLIFTESRKTQEFLYEKLLEEGYEGVLLYNGTNTSDEAKQIYEEWILKDCNQDKINSNRSVNMRTAILEKFKESGKILISTEAGAEGLNLQFCSLVINYDLPWNPQRVEQRIGRCHRFGQKFDVVVINFISSNNAVEQRIFELLNNKFKIFEEILGSSDTVLGSIEDGKNIENAIIEIYSKCRTNEEINKAFDKLQNQFKEDIDLSMKKTRADLIDNFDEDLQQYFKDVMISTENTITKIERMIWSLLKLLWKDKISFCDNFAFEYDKHYYCLSSKNNENKYIDFNLKTVLGQNLIETAKRIDRKKGHIVFNLTAYPYKITRLNELIGRKGYLILNKLNIKSFEEEEHLVFNGILDDGSRIDPEVCELLFRLDTIEYDEIKDSKPKLFNDLMEDSKVNVHSILTESENRNNKMLSDEINRINSCIDDKIQAVQLEVEQMRNQRKELQMQSDLVSNMKEKEEIEKNILELSSKIRKNWIKLAENEEKLEFERTNMIESIKKQNMRKYEIDDVFIVSFEIK